MMIPRAYVKHICFLLFLLLLFSGGCRRAPSGVRRILEASGDNKPQLEKVLEHYREQGDRQKLKAAYFLIGNMKNKYFYDDELIRKYDVLFPLYDSLRRMGVSGDGDLLLRAWDTLVYQFGPLTQSGHKLLFDARSIKAEYLVGSIDDAFVAWKNVPWHDSVDFKTFMRYVLPYRTSQEPLESYRMLYYDRYQELRDTMKHPRDMVAFARAVSNDIYFRLGFRASGKLWSYPFSIPASKMELGRRGACRHQVDYVAWVLRSNGVPVTIDRAVWGDRNDGHTWDVILLPDDRIFPFESLDPDMNYQKLAYRPAKVFRATFENKGTELTDNLRADVPPSLFLVDEVDVTDQYAQTCQVSVPVQFPFQGGDRKRYGVLCTFDNKDWRPVDYGPIRFGRMHFSKTPVNLVYITMFFNHGRLVPASDPFLLDSLGHIRYLKVDPTKTQTLSLNRKYPLFPATREHMTHLQWCRIEVADKPDFSDAIELFQLDFLPEQFVDTALLCDTPHRYVRLRIAAQHKGNLAEVEFYGRSSSTGEEERLTGTAIGVPLRDAEGNVPFLKALDGDLETYFEKPRPDTAWVGYDLGRKKFVSRVRFCPRSDTNFILPGDVYELRYWKDGVWVSHGSLTGEGPRAVFREVPSGGLYWLRNATRGKEERIFTYEDGKQVFW